MNRLYPYTALLIILIFIGCGNNHLTPYGSGLIEATEIKVAVETGGRLMQLHYDNGDHINLNDTIGIIDTTTVILRLNQIEAINNAALTQLEIARLGITQADQNFDLAEKEYNRAKALIKTGSVNRQRYDQAENMYEQSRLAIKQAETAYRATEADLKKIKAEYEIVLKQKDNCFPKAPLSGRIVDKYVDPGELMAPGMALIKIARLDTVEVKIYLPPSDLTRINAGDKATVDAEDGRNSSMSGVVSWIASSAEFSPKNVQTKEARADLVYAVKVKIPNPDERLKIGMPVMVTIDK